MIAFIRRSYRIAALLLWCIVLMVAASLSFGVVFGKWNRVRLGAFWTRFWSRGAAWIVGLRVRIFGAIPEGNGLLVVSNHLGYLDILAHGSTFKLRFAPKAEIRKWPFFGWLTALGSPVWIDRKNPRMSAVYAEEFKATMEHGISMLVYPEGTSSDGKHGLLPFKSTPFAAALSSGSNILPTLIFYRQRGNSSFNAAWYDDTPFGVHVWRVLGEKGTDVDLHILPVAELDKDDDRKRLASRIYDIMKEEYWQIERSH